MVHLGCHLSPSLGYRAMGETALSIGADTLQFFTRNPRGGQAKDINEADWSGLRGLQEEGKLGKIIAHGAYTINPCAADPNIRKFAWKVMADDLARMEFLPGNYYNFHPGSHVGQGMEEGIRKITEVLNSILCREQTTVVLLETMAGKGSEVGGRFEELQRILDGVLLPDKMGVCLDTCHIFDGGYDIVADPDGVLAEFDRVIGLDRLCAVHLNDSMNGLGSHKDRHQKIGQGSIGLSPMLYLLQHPALQGKPVILETPNDLPGYTAEIQLLREALAESGGNVS